MTDEYSTGDTLPPHLTDEATGLPPMKVIDPNHLMYLSGAVTDGKITINGVETPVRFITMRGVGNRHGTGMGFKQVQVAIPKDVAMDVALLITQDLDLIAPGDADADGR